MARMLQQGPRMSNSSSEIPPRSRGEARAGAERSPAVRAIVLPAQRYVHTAQTGGLVLMVSAVVALAAANSPLQDVYDAFWRTRLSIGIAGLHIDEDLAHWVSDGLMTLFFLVVGLEVKRELSTGELSTARRAALPAFAAFGGMLAPAALYLAVAAADAPRGWGVPIATDIAFALGVLALAGNRVPSEVRTLLLALAAVDDIGGILVIGLFYSTNIVWPALMAFVLLVGAATALNALGIRHLFLYMVVGAAAWLALLESGVHPTLTGVVFGLLAPTRPDVGIRRFTTAARALVDELQHRVGRGEQPAAASILGQVEELARGTEPPVERLVRVIHPWVSFLVLPLFALANAAIPFSIEAVRAAAGSPAAQGIVLGLVAGKAIGILAVTWAAVRLGLAELPDTVSWHHMTGVALLAGIGFTVSLFITELAFSGGPTVGAARLAVLVASLVSAVAGLVWLRRAVPPAR